MTQKNGDNGHADVNDPRGILDQEELEYIKQEEEVQKAQDDLDAAQRAYDRVGWAILIGLIVLIAIALFILLATSWAIT